MQKLNQANYQQILDYTNQNPTANLFIIGDLMQIGFDDSIQQFYGRIENNQLVNIFFYYYDGSVHLYANDLNEDDFQFMTDFIKKNQIDKFNFASQTAPLIQEFLKENHFKAEQETLSVYQVPKNNLKNPQYVIQKATLDDVQEIAKLSIQVFGEERDFEQSVAIMSQDLIKQKSWTYFTKADKKIVAIATAVAFSDKAAMIIGVATDPDYRNMGYASSVVQTLCDDLKKTNRSAVLFWDNPAAASIYHKIGFVDQEKYYMGKKG